MVTMTFCSHSILPTATLLFHYLKYPKCTGNLNLHRPPHNNHHRSLFQVNTHARHSFSLSLLHSSQTILEAPPQLTPHEDAHFGPCSLRRQPRRHSWGRWSTAAHTQSHSAGGNCRTRFFPKPRAEGLTDRAKITPGAPTPGAQRGPTRPPGGSAAPERTRSAAPAGDGSRTTAAGKGSRYLRRKESLADQRA